MSYLIDKNLIQEWEQNPKFRNITKKGEEQLEANLLLGQHTTLLVYKDPNGQYISLGGNQRLKKMKTMNYEEIDCTVLEFGEDDLGFFPIFNGRTYKDAEGEIPVHFETIDQGMIEIALSHNTSPGHNKKEGIEEIAQANPQIDYWKYEAQFNEKVSIADVRKDKVEPDANNKAEFLVNTLQIKVIFDNDEEFKEGVSDIEEMLAEKYPAAYIKYVRGGKK